MSLLLLILVIQAVKGLYFLFKTMIEQTSPTPLQTAILNFIKEKISTLTIPLDELRSSVGNVGIDETIVLELVEKAIQIPTNEGGKIFRMLNSVKVEDGIMKFELSKEMVSYLRIRDKNKAVE